MSAFLTNTDSRYQQQAGLSTPIRPAKYPLISTSTGLAWLDDHAFDKRPKRPDKFEIGQGVQTGTRLVSSTGDRTVQLGSRIILAAVASCLASCSQEVEYSEQQRACIAQRYTEFDARKLSQCVDVCKACMNGNTVTCNTSCKLSGAN